MAGQDCTVSAPGMLGKVLDQLQVGQARLGLQDHQHGRGAPVILAFGLGTSSLVFGQDHPDVTHRTRFRLTYTRFGLNSAKNRLKSPPYTRRIPNFGQYLALILVN